MIWNTYWTQSFEKPLVPEQFLKITMSIVDDDAVSNASIDEVNSYPHGRSALSRVVRNNADAPDPTAYGSYATLETNLWTLDGTKKIPADSYEGSDLGYVSRRTSKPTLVLNFSEPAAKTIPGLTIVWSSEYNEYPTKFSIQVKKPNGSISWKTVTDNHSPMSIVEWELSDYDYILIESEEWNTPEHYHRIDRVVPGLTWTFEKEDILSYSHEQTGDLLCAELPKNSIEFSLDNTDGKWDPFNPVGIGKYLSERQAVIVKYGLREYKSYGENVNWINAGTFYLSEWDTPANGLEARFVARDPIEFMMSTWYGELGVSVGKFQTVVESAVGLCEFPNGFEMNIDSTWQHDQTVLPPDYLEEVKSGANTWMSPKYTVAEIIQLCVGAMCSVCWFDRDGVFQIVEKPWEKNAGMIYEIPLDVSYSYPEIKLNKPVKYVEITYTPTDASSGYYKFDTELSGNGVTQTIDNPMGLYFRAMSNMYQYAKGTFKKRAVVSGEFRANPCLDVFDNVKVTTKYGDMNLIVTRIKYTYNGSFHGEYTAQGYEEIASTEVSE